MDTMSKCKKLQAIDSVDQKTQFFSNLIFYSFVALTCALLCSYPYWISNMKHFVFLSLPNVFSFFSTPKWLFIVINIIVVFLVGESKFLGSHPDPAGEIYDEYVERSTGLRSSPTPQGKAAEASKVVMKLDEEMVTTNNVEHDEEVKVEDKEIIEILKRDEKYQVMEVEDIEEEEAENEKDEEEEEEEEEIGLPAEELNRRVEEFIARVNKQRWLEARSIVCCVA